VIQFESFATHIKFVANKTKLSGGNSATFFSDDEFFLSAQGFLLIFE